MTTRGVIGPLRITPASAARVADLILSRVTDRNCLADTPLEHLPILADKLRKAAARRRRSNVVSIYTVTRAEAVAGFHYLACYFHPNVPEGALSDEERRMVNEVALDLGRALKARPGPARLLRADAEHVVGVYQQHRNRTLPARLDHIIPDGTYAKRLAARLKRQAEIEQTPVYPLPAALLRILSR